MNDEFSLNPHQLWAIWSEDGTEMIEFGFSEDEMKSALDTLRQNDCDPTIYHIAAYDLNHATKSVPDPFEDDLEDYDDE